MNMSTPSEYLLLPLRSEMEARVQLAVKRQAAANYARQLAAKFFNQRVSTIYDPRNYTIEPWCAFFGSDWDETPEIIGRGANEAQAIRRLIEATLARRGSES